MMSLIKKYCIMCGLYHSKSKMHLTDGIGICRKCYQKLIRTGDMTFDGMGDVKLVIAPYLYKGDIRDAIKKLKFSGQWKYGEILGEMISLELERFPWLSEYDMVVPVPLHQTRLNERGYNQAEIIAGRFAQRIEVPIVLDVLFRIRETKKQSSLLGLERVLNVKGAFAAAESAVKGKRIILVDDICTMGKTMEACAQALSQAGAKEIIGVAVCKSEIN